MTFALTFVIFSLQFSSLVESRTFLRGHNETSRDAPYLSAILNGISSGVRPFFVLIAIPVGETIEEGHIFCGGSIIDPIWVITNHRCIHRHRAEDLLVKVGEFTNPQAEMLSYRITRKIVTDHLVTNDQYDHAVALLKLASPIPDPESRVIALCAPESYSSRSLGTVGMGVTNMADMTLPQHMQQTYFRESAEVATNMYESMMCSLSLVCAESVSVLGQSNICFLDEGGPLYTFGCNSFEPHCLYGVAAFHWSSPTGNQDNVHMCTRNFFTRIGFVHEWIKNTIENN